MSDRSPTPRPNDTSDSDETSVHEADVRNGEPDALDATRPSSTRDDDPGQRLQPEDDIDVTEPTDDGEPIHRVSGGDIGEGAD